MSIASSSPTRESKARPSDFFGQLTKTGSVEQALDEVLFGKAGRGHCG